MRPMPGMDVLSFGAAVIILHFFFDIIIKLNFDFACAVLHSLVASQKFAQMLPRIFLKMLILVQEKKKVVSKGSETKRLRKERGELEKIIFKLFERQPYWTSKQLIQETDQPEVRFIFDLFFVLLYYFTIFIFMKQRKSIDLSKRNTVYRIEGLEG